MRVVSAVVSVHTIEERCPSMAGWRTARPGENAPRRGRVRPLMRHGGDDRRLAVPPAVRRDARRSRIAGGRRRRRPAGAPRRSSRRRGWHGRAPRAGEIVHRRRHSGRRASRLGGQRRDKAAVLDHVSERFARLDLAGEGQKGRPHRVVEPAVGDHHVEDRLGLRGDRLPHAERLEQAAGGGAIADARSSRAGAAERRIRDRDGEAGPNA